MERVTVGRIVHVTHAERGCQAAIVTHVYGDTHVVSLWVFGDGGLEFFPHVSWHAVPAPGTWHWPERG